MRSAERRVRGHVALRHAAWGPGDIAVMRRERGWTQEDLAERSGLSVRTVRNVELGKISPRASTVTLLARALDIDQPHAAEAARGARDQLWYGPLPPTDPTFGDHEALERHARTVLSHTLTTFVGPGGVGKTRHALAVAARLAPRFSDGVAVVELGDLPKEGAERGGEVRAEVARRVQTALDALGQMRGTQAPHGALNALLVLDNAEHLPGATFAVVRTVLASSCRLHVLITSRRRLTDRLGANIRIRPLRACAIAGEVPSDAPAVRLLLRHVGGMEEVARGLAKDPELVCAMCRWVDGIPRYLEFIAERLRTLPLTSVSSAGSVLRILRSDDHVLLPHQRSAAESIRWSVALLGEEHRRLLDLPAVRQADGFALRDLDSFRTSSLSPLELLSDLLEDCLLVSESNTRPHFHLPMLVRESLGTA